MGAVGPGAPPGRRGPAANSSAGECGAKDQVSRAQPMQGGEDSEGTAGRWRARPAREGGATLDVDVVGRKDEVPDEVRARAKAKVEKLGRLAPVLERAEVRLAEDRDAPVASRKLCEVTMTGPRPHDPGPGRRPRPRRGRRQGGRQARAPGRAAQGQADRPLPPPPRPGAGRAAGADRGADADVGRGRGRRDAGAEAGRGEADVRPRPTEARSRPAARGRRPAAQPRAGARR